MRWRRAQILYIAVCAGLAGFVWLSWSAALPQYRNEVLIAASLLLYYVFAFPSSVLFGLLYVELVMNTPIGQFDAGNAYLNWMFSTFVPQAFLVYLQWLVFVPWLWRKTMRWWKARRARGAASS